MTQEAGRDARRWCASLAVCLRSSAVRAALALLLGIAPRTSADAQAIARPWLDWRTTETEHFIFHYPAEYRAWTLALAERIEGVKSQVEQVVGYGPRARVHVVIDDPANVSNGFAFTPLDAPTMVLWPTPPDPRSEIGNYRVWQELLATHEYAHIAHLTRPSRNRLRRLLWAYAPVPLGPVAAGAPRWVLEGYATYVEGRVSGTGRPNNAWRAAILRQFALEGRLPTYTQLDATGAWESGSFAYLAGSAYLEWLARRQGDSSIVALWRRLTAVTPRSFDQAFAGVYGDAPAVLYARFVAELTADALAVERALGRDALVDGTLVQRLSRNTGDPAISPDGRFIALAIRRTDAPSELVVWKTEDEPDTLGTRRSDAQLKRDPDDVPDRSFYPPPKRVVISLLATDGAPYESPRWMPDNRHLLLTRRVPTSDGSLRSDLFQWSAEDGGLARITRGAGIRDADPSADGRWAAAVQCTSGWCDLVRVDLATGAVRVIVPGSSARNFYRPRVSRRDGDIVVAEQSGDRWRIVRVDPATGASRYVDPDDGATRYDATFDVDGRTVLATSEAGGIPNVERLAEGGAPQRLTAVAGAAVAADVAPDGALWFLSLHSGGYDLRRVRPDSASIARAARLTSVALGLGVDSLSPVLPPRTRMAAADSSRRPQRGPVSDERRYGIGPDVLRYIPGVSTGYGGSSVQLALLRTDPVGRLSGQFLAVVGAGALPEGVALNVISRRWRTEIVTNGWVSHEAPSRHSVLALEQGLDLTRFGGALRLRRQRVGDAGELIGTLGVLSERQEPTDLTPATRNATFAVVDIRGRQRDAVTRYQEQVQLLGEMGNTDGGAYLRQRAAVFFGFGGHSRPLSSLRLGYGTVGGGDGSVRERYTIGGFASPLLEPVLDGRRVDAPAYPLGSAAGSTFSTYRLAVPFRGFELFYGGASPDMFHTAFRSYGVELREQVAPIAALGTPGVTVLAGFARAVDEPVKKEWRYYLSLTIAP